MALVAPATQRRAYASAASPGDAVPAPQAAGAGNLVESNKVSTAGEAEAGNAFSVTG